MPNFEGLNERWARVALHMQSRARRNQGAAIVSVKVVVDQNGNPKTWNEPEIHRLNPRTESMEIINLLTGE